MIFDNTMYYVLGVSLLVQCFNCNPQMGPDPWEEVNVEKNILEDDDLPPDLRIPNQVTKVKVETNQCMSDFFFKRLLAIILKGGRKRDNEDNTMDISLQMRYNQEQLKILNEYITSTHSLTETMLRRSIEYIGDSIHKPKITEEIAMAWNEYVYSYFIEYKMHITWSLGIAAVVATFCWLWHYISYKHMLIIIAIALYFYEVFVSYKEAEKKEVARFLSDIEACQWRFWTSNCEVTPPDPITFLKHMNPLKIAVRMFTTIISEPMITISATANEILHTITGDLVYPINIVAKIILVVIFNAFLIFLLVSVAFNFILNIPFQLNLFHILSIALKPRQRYETTHVPEQGDRITAETLNRFLDLCSKALSVTQNSQNIAINNSSTNQGEISQGIKRSASTGRLPNAKSNFNQDFTKRKHAGSGDA